jgi:hypothetical protein
MVKATCYQCRNEFNPSQLELYSHGTQAFFCCTNCRYELIQYQEKKAGKNK